MASENGDRNRTPTLAKDSDLEPLAGDPPHDAPIVIVPTARARYDDVVLPSVATVDAGFNTSTDIFASSSAMRSMLLAGVAQSPVSLIVHNIGNAVVVDTDLNGVLLADVTANASHVRASHVSSLPAALPCVSPPSDATVPEPLLMLTNHAANSPFRPSLLQRNESLQRDADLLLRLTALHVSPTLCSSEAPSIPGDPFQLPSGSVSVAETAITVYTSTQSRVIGLETAGVKAVTSLSDASLDESAFTVMSRLVAVDLWLNASFSDASGASRDVSTPSQEIITTHHKYTYSSACMSYFASLLAFLKASCTREDVSYWVHSDPRDGNVKVYSFEVPSDTAVGSAPLPSFQRPVALLCLRAAEKVFSMRYVNEHTHNPSPRVTPRVPDAMESLVSSYNPALCRHLYRRVLQLIDPNADSVVWCTVEFRLASIHLHEHCYPVNPKQSPFGRRFAEDVCQDWLVVEPPGDISMSPSHVVTELLDEERIRQEAVFAALPHVLTAAHLLRASAKPTPEVIRLDAQLRIAMCCCLLTLAKFAYLRGDFGRALKLCGQCELWCCASVPSDSSWTVDSLAFQSVHCEALVIVGRVFAEMSVSGVDVASVLSDFRASVGLCHDLRSSPHDDDWLSNDKASVPAASQDVVDLLVACIPRLAPPNVAIVSEECFPATFGRFAALPVFNGSSASDKDTLSYTAVQCFVKAYQSSSPFPVHGTWSCHVVSWVSACYCVIGEAFLSRGRVTKAIEHYKQGEVMFGALGMDAAVAVLQYQVARVVQKPQLLSVSEVKTIETQPEALVRRLPQATDALHQFRRLHAVLQARSVFVSECRHILCDGLLAQAAVFASLASTFAGIHERVSPLEMADAAILTYLSAWFTVNAVIVNGSVDESVKRVSGKTLLSDSLWRCASEDCDALAANLYREAVNVAASDGAVEISVMEACHECAAFVRGVALDGLVNFARKRAVVVSRLQRFYRDFETHTDAVLRVCNKECDMWKCVCELIPDDQSFATECCSAILARVAASIPAFQRTAVTPSDYPWTAVSDSLAFALRFLLRRRKDTDGVRQAYSTLLRNPNQRNTASELLCDVMSPLST